MLKHKIISFEKRVNSTCEVGLRALPQCEKKERVVAAPSSTPGRNHARHKHSLNEMNSPFKIVK
jgi:hypothetical protein